MKKSSNVFKSEEEQESRTVLPLNFSIYFLYECDIRNFNWLGDFFSVRPHCPT